MIRLVTGGARSGKSKFAENLFANYQDVCYIATSRVEDEEMRQRVALHREMRSSIWRTYEGNYDLSKAVGSERHYILDCLTVLTSNIMFDLAGEKDRIDRDLMKEIEECTMKEVSCLIRTIREFGGELTMVTNEVGMSIVPEHHISRVFRDIQGRVNQRVAELCDEVYLVVVGQKVRLK